MANPTGKGGQRKGEPSRNPAGRPAVAQAFRERARHAVDEHVLDAWVGELTTRGDQWMRAAEMLAAYGYGKPSESLKLDGQQQVEIIIRTEPAPTSVAALDPDAEFT
jgi:hypothetical protein